MNHPKPWLRYVDADDIDDLTLDIAGMKVRNPAGESLGNVDGFIVDSQSGRTYYIVVDAGGWFKTRQFLLPIGRVHLDDDRDALVVNLSKEHMRRFPGFDTDEFEKLTEADIKRINDDVCIVFGETVLNAPAEPYAAAWKRASFRYPDWWPEAGVTTTRRERSYHEERSVANDENIRSEGRAQPGDVIGVETGGERTQIGDTADDEDKRRAAAEKASRKK